jgi:hypothetical protein
MKPLFYISILCSIIGCIPAQQEGSNLKAKEILQQAIHRFTEAPGYALEAHFHRVENGKVMQDEDAQVYFLVDSLDQVCQCQKRVIIPHWNLDFQYAGLATEVNHKSQGVKIEKVESNPLLNLFDAYGFWDITRIFSIHQQFIKELKNGIATVYPLQEADANTWIIKVGIQRSTPGQAHASTQEFSYYIDKHRLQFKQLHSNFINPNLDMVQNWKVNIHSIHHKPSEIKQAIKDFNIPQDYQIIIVPSNQYTNQQIPKKTPQKLFKLF